MEIFKDVKSHGKQKFTIKKKTKTKTTKTTKRKKQNKTRPTTTTFRPNMKCGIPDILAHVTLSFLPICILNITENLT